jgi:hypothetical protein
VLDLRDANDVADQIEAEQALGALALDPQRDAGLGSPRIRSTDSFEVRFSVGSLLILTM